MNVNYLNARAEFLEWHQIPLTDKLPKQIAMGCQLWPFFQGRTGKEIKREMVIYGRKAAKNGAFYTGHIRAVVLQPQRHQMVGLAAVFLI